MILVMGGGGSGKSEYAENLLSDVRKNKFYIAAMKPFGSEGLERVRKHKRMREGKCFTTIEQPTDIEESLKAMNKESAALIECISNLAANEMFKDENEISGDIVVKKIVNGISRIDSTIARLVIVTNNIYEDGILYDETTRAYMKALSDINIQLAAKAERVIEVVAGIPVVISEREILSGNK